ncbi:MAG: LysM domain-containing protein [Lactobacillus sp.]|jgi:LysM repeat protein|nr:LysM domain-containing protein [Lactobacillus sp.]
MKKSTLIAFAFAGALTAVTALNPGHASAAVDNGNGTVTVQAGDSYMSIANSKGMSVAALEQLNGREVGGYDVIYPGETVSVNTYNAAATTTPAATTQTATTQQSVSQAPAATQTATQSAGSYKISFYDPAVLGSNMGYNGVAANLSVFPKGTHLRITLSDGTVLDRVVNDTGTFAYSNPQQLDVAMPNASIPSYGVTTASVQVIG